MNQKIAFILFSTSIFLSATCVAQKESKQFSAGFGIEAGVPTGSTSNYYSFTGGLTIRFSYHAGPGFVTLTGGGIAYAPKSGEGEPKKAGIQIPIRAGYKYIIQHHFFVMGEFGYSHFTTYYGNGQGGVASAGSVSAIGALSAGYQLNAFELGLRYGFTMGNQGSGVFGVRIGFNF